jgi:hypothetical protein
LLAAQLSLPVVDRELVCGVHGQREVDVFLAQVYVPALKFTEYGKFAGVELKEGGHRQHILLGRTFLSHFALVYDGKNRKGKPGLLAASRFGEFVFRDDQDAAHRVLKLFHVEHRQSASWHRRALMSADTAGPVEPAAPSGWNCRTPAGNSRRLSPCDRPHRSADEHPSHRAKADRGNLWTVNDGVERDRADGAADQHRERRRADPQHAASPATMVLAEKAAAARACGHWRTFRRVAEPWRQPAQRRSTIVSDAGPDNTRPRNWRRGGGQDRWPGAGQASCVSAGKRLLYEEEASIERVRLLLLPTSPPHRSLESPGEYTAQRNAARVRRFSRRRPLPGGPRGQSRPRRCTPRLRPHPLLRAPTLRS